MWTNILQVESVISVSFEYSSDKKTFVNRVIVRDGIKIIQKTLGAFETGQQKQGKI